MLHIVIHEGSLLGVSRLSKSEALRRTACWRTDYSASIIHMRARKPLLQAYTQTASGIPFASTTNSLDFPECVHDCCAAAIIVHHVVSLWFGWNLSGRGSWLEKLASYWLESCGHHVMPADRRNTKTFADNTKQKGNQQQARPRRKEGSRGSPLEEKN